MKNKLSFLTKMSLKKKIKTKWFLIANIIFAILLIGLINIDSIITAFGGDFSQEKEIIISSSDQLLTEKAVNYFKEYNKIIDNKMKIKSFKENSDNLKITKDNQVLLNLTTDEFSHLSVSITSQKNLDISLENIINSILRSLQSEIVLEKYHISKEVYDDINYPVNIKKIIAEENDYEKNSIIQLLILPIFMLIVFLVQMIGAEINEEKNTKSMEIIISNVSPKIHFASKILSANIFVIIQGLLLLIYGSIGLVIRYCVSSGNITAGFTNEFSTIFNTLSLDGISKSISYTLPIIIIMLLLTFLAYSLVAGILASMTTNLEDYQQLQTPIVIVLLAGFYLSMMANLFKGSLFIKIMSYIPFVSSMLAPSLYIMGEISIFDLCISLGLLVLVIYLLIKYGLRIYKVGILNYSETGLWKKIFKSLKGKD